MQETQTVEGDSAVIGFTINGGAESIFVGYTVGGTSGLFLEDTRAQVTQVGERTVNIEEIVTPAGGGTVEAEIKAPTVISISLHLSF